MHRVARLPLAALLALIMVGVLGCSPDLEPVEPAPGLVPSASPSGTAATSSRDLVAVPDAVPAGVVDPPAGQGLGRYTSQALSWEPCLEELQCATFATPLDWSDPDGAAITLTMSRLAAQGRSRGTIFVNPGGPGGSGLGLPRALPLNGLNNFDIVGWDPRGVGESTPVRCLDDQQTAAYLQVDDSPDTPAEVTALQQADRRLGLACVASSGVLAEHITTEETVRDLELMRVLLRQPTMNLYGASYGTVIGSMYATLFPTTSGRLVLDGAVVLGADSDQVRGFTEAFAAFAAWCAAKKCDLGDTGQEVVATTTALLDRLDRQPLPVKGRSLTQSLAVDGIVQWLYFDASTYPRLRDAIEAAVKGDGDLLLRFSDVANDRDTNGAYGQINAAFPAIRCLDETDDGVSAALADARKQAAELGGIAPYLGPDFVCPEWPIAARPVGRTLDAAGAPPILVIGTTGDPATPYSLAEQLTRQLDGARLLTYDGVGHTAFGTSSCIQSAVIAYFRNGKLPAEGKRCSS